MGSTLTANVQVDIHTHNCQLICSYRVDSCRNRPCMLSSYICTENQSNNYHDLKFSNKEIIYT